MPCIWMIYNPELDKELQEEEVIDLICFVYLWAKRRNTIDGCLVLGLDGHFLLNRCTRISFIVFFFFYRVLYEQLQSKQCVCKTLEVSGLLYNGMSNENM